MTGNQRIPEVDRRLEAGMRTLQTWLSDLFSGEPDNRGVGFGEDEMRFAALSADSRRMRVRHSSSEKSSTTA